MALSACATASGGNSVSTASDRPSSTPSPSSCAWARRASTLARMMRTSASSAWPAGVRAGL
ncbi:Uncharacterised protein [Bordetella pertussis]|nr:Uncharacterised protein [Bordetella pertussis]